MISNTVTFALGVGVGIYIAQNYTLPDMKKMVDKSLKVATSLERAARKDE